jgi:hypothetical protein
MLIHNMHFKARTVQDKHTLVQGQQMRCNIQYKTGRPLAMQGEKHRASTVAKALLHDTHSLQVLPTQQHTSTALEVLIHIMTCTAAPDTATHTQANTTDTHSKLPTQPTTQNIQCFQNVQFKCSTGAGRTKGHQPPKDSQVLPAACDRKPPGSNVCCTLPILLPCAASSLKPKQQRGHESLGAM